MEIKELVSSPLFGVTVTLVAYQLALYLNKACRGTPLLHPVIVSMTALIIIFTATGVTYEDYFKGASYIHFMLGPATVALAVPLYENFEKVKKLLIPIIIATLCGSATAVLSAVLLVKLFGGSLDTIISIAPKTVTTPIAMGVSEKIGGVPSLTAGMVLITGAIGCVVAPVIYKIFNITDDGAKGLALGLSSHGFGTAQAFQISAVAGAFSGLALGLTGVVVAFLLPYLIRYIA
ncbi:MAG: LrgB family protein [Gammaproteobacteria bacterium]|nr:MAG: LrgB family protein [Gammaproteobacteria bacterium]